MFGLLELLLLTVLALFAVYWLQSGLYKGRARALAEAHCRSLDLQLLDQGMVITGIWPVRGVDGRLRLRRRYQFEFASLGDRRYRGEIVLLGTRLQSIDLEAYKMPLDE
jgi:hypothetical protein